MIIREEIDLNKPVTLTAVQKQMLENLKTRLVQPDEDCPELTSEQLAKLASAARERNHLNKINKKRGYD